MTAPDAHRDDDDSDLDAGLEAAFGASSTVEPSVLGRIERLTGVKTSLPVAVGAPSA